MKTSRKHKLANALLLVLTTILATGCWDCFGRHYY